MDGVTATVHHHAAVHHRSEARISPNWPDRAVVEISLTAGNHSHTFVVERVTAARLINQLRLALDAKEIENEENRS